MNKITIAVSELKRALPGFSRVTNKRTTLPVLGCILFQSRQGQLQLIGTNLDDYVVRSIGPVEPQFNAAIPLESPHKILKGCPADAILTIEALKDEVRIKYPFAGTVLTERVSCPVADEFPPVPSPEWHEPVTVGEDFKQAIREALDSASTDESRYILNSAYVDVSDPKAHYIVATNGRELYSANSFQLGFKDSVIVPNRKFLVWKTFMEDGDWEISLSVPLPPNHKGPALNCIKVQSKSWTLITKQIDGTYPHWKAPIPQPSEAAASVTFTPEASEFVINAAPRLPGTSTQNQPVAIRTDRKAVFLAGRDANNEASLPVVGATSEGKNSIIGLNREYLVKAMKLGLTTAEIHTGEMPIAVFKKDGKRLVIAGLRPDVAQAVTSTSSTQPAPQTSHSNAPQEESTNEQNRPMKTANRIEQVSTETANNGASAPASAFEQVRIQMENVRDKLKSVVTDINESLKLLAQAQKERRATEKEIEEVRETLQSLQKIRI